jgi:hypothetical protein
MKKVFREHSEAVLITLAIIFLAVLIGFVYETMQVVVTQIDRAIIAPSPSMGVGFDLNDAASVDYKGLAGVPVPTSTTSTAPAETQATTPTPTPVPTQATTSSSTAL